MDDNLSSFWSINAYMQAPGDYYPGVLWWCLAATLVFYFPTKKSFYPHFYPRAPLRFRRYAICFVVTFLLLVSLWYWRSQVDCCLLLYQWGRPFDFYRIIFAKSNGVSQLEIQTVLFLFFVIENCCTILIPYSLLFVWNTPRISQRTKHILVYMMHTLV